MSHSSLARLRRLLPDPYIIALFGMVVLASLLPVHGAGALLFGHVTDAAIALLFFLYGSRLSPRDVLDGMRDVRLHGLVLCFTYLVFPLVGLASGVLVPWWLTPELQVGVVFLCVLPSTVQSSIAFTSLARGNVAAALCSASLSNLLGVGRDRAGLLRLQEEHGQRAARGQRAVRARAAGQRGVAADAVSPAAAGGVRLAGAPLCAPPPTGGRDDCQHPMKGERVPGPYYRSGPG